jgi:hypothetical protein
VRAAQSWADAHLAAPRTVCMIAPDNAASIHVAEKCGYREWTRSTYKGDATILFERARRLMDATSRGACAGGENTRGTLLTPRLSFPGQQAAGVSSASSSVMRIERRIGRSAGGSRGRVSDSRVSRYLGM